MKRDGRDMRAPVASIAEIAARMEPQPATFDQRPGTLDAIGGPCPGLVVVGARFGPEWKVLCIVRDEKGAIVQLALDPDEARRSAAQLIQFADLVERPGMLA